MAVPDKYQTCLTKTKEVKCEKSFEIEYFKRQNIERLY